MELSKDEHDIWEAMAQFFMIREIVIECSQKSGILFQSSRVTQARRVDNSKLRIGNPKFVHFNWNAELVDIRCNGNGVAHFGYIGIIKQDVDLTN